MADIALSSVGEIVKVGLAIKEAVETVQQNKEDCLAIQNGAVRITAIVKRIEETKKMDDPVMRDALEDLENCLQQALELVNECKGKERHIGCLFCKAKDLSKKLRRVQEDIQRGVSLGTFACAGTTMMLLTNIEGALQPQPQNAGASSGDTTDDSRSDINRIETDIKDNNVVTEIRDTPIPSLDGFTVFTLAEMKDATNVFSQDNLIGEGGFGKVYKGTLRDGQLVAIKTFANYSNMSHMMTREFDIISKVEHRNIVKCLGYANADVNSLVPMGDGFRLIATETYICLVHEYMENGDLDRINRGKRADWSARFKLIDGIAQAVCFIHGQWIVHMDLKPSNILLDSDMNAKIADFGISRMFGEERTRINNMNVVGTLGYMAPEYVFRGEISTNADVYAFGVILLGTIIGGMCKGDLRGPVEWAREARVKNHRQFTDLFSKKEQFMELLDPSLFDESQLEQIKTCLDIGLRCVEIERKKRPTMAAIVHELDRMKDAAGSLKNPGILRRLTSYARHK